MTISYPPRYLPYPAAVKYAKTVPAELRDFFASLYGLAWASKYVSTPPLNVGELLDFLGISERTYNDYVQALAGLTWLRSELTGTGCVRFYFPRVFRIPSSKVTIQTAKGLKPSAEFCGRAQNSAENGEEEEDLKREGKKLNSSSSSSTDIRRLLQCAGVRNSQIENVVADTSITLEIALAECARTFDNARARDKGYCIGANLIKKDFPGAIFYGRLDLIPTEVLRQAGLESLLTTEPSEPGDEDDDNPSDDPGGDADRRASAAVECDPTLHHVVINGRTAADIWKIAIESVRLQMPGQAFGKYLQPAEPLRFADGALIVGCENQFARDWLDDRLSSTMARLLAAYGINKLVFEVVSS